MLFSMMNFITFIWCIHLLNF